jgi:hypothetical protein
MVHRLLVLRLHIHPDIQMGKVLAILILQKQLAEQVRGKNGLIQKFVLGVWISARIRAYQDTAH